MTIRLHPPRLQRHPSICRSPYCRKKVVMQTQTSWRQRERRVEFRNGRGEKLVGTLVEAPSTKTVILCHGYSDNRDTAILRAFAEQIDEIPLSSFRFDFSGNGESEGIFEFGNYWEEVEDIRSAVEHLSADNREIHALIGHSKAGGTVLLYASRYDDVPLVINISGRFHMERGIKERFGSDIFVRLEREGHIEASRKLPNREMTTFTLTKKSMDSRLNLDMGEAVKKIKKSRVLTVHGNADTTIPVKDAEEFASCIAQHELAVIDEADHNFTQQKHLQALVEKGIAFLV